MEKEIMKMLKEMKSDMDKRFDSIDKRLDGMDKRFDGIEATLKEHGQILNALEERTKVDSARIENLEHEMSRVIGEVKGIKESVSSLSMITAQNWRDLEELKLKVG